MLSVERYTSNQKPIWDEHIKSAKNGHFLFMRDYMEYHSDRFTDHSLLFFLDGELIAVLPANVKDNTLYSHQGLTFGGVISNSKMTTLKMQTIFEAMESYLLANNIIKVIYKKIPYFYCNLPSEEDMYFLGNKSAARIYRTDITSTIDYTNKVEFSQRRIRGVKKAIKANLVAKMTSDLTSFHAILSEILQSKYGTKPTHSIEELSLLTSKFPDNIKLFGAFDSSNRMLASVLIYEMHHWVHAQYICVSEEGKEIGALDFLFDHLINTEYPNKKYFDFGISTEDQGKVLNAGLINQKEEFGGRAVVQVFYEWSLV